MFTMLKAKEPLPPDGLIRVDSPLARALRFVVATLLAAALAYVVYLRLPAELDVTTDIVGYPIHSNFNIDRYFHLYYLGTVFIPIVTLLIYLALQRVVPLSLPRLVIQSPRDRVAALPGSKAQSAVGRLWRAAFVGFVIAVETVMAAGLEGAAFRLTIVGLVAAYLVAVRSLSRVLRWRRVAPPADAAHLVVNVLLTPLVVVGLAAVSGATRVLHTIDGSVRAFGWMPLGLAIAGALALWTWIGLKVRSAKAFAQIEALEDRALLWVVAPVLIFLVHGHLPGPLGSFDVFHEGEGLAVAHLIREGLFPWKDIIFIHGLLEDFFTWALGMLVFEDSRWGAAAGKALLLMPLYWVLVYALHARLFRHNRLFLLFTVVAAATGLMSHVSLRFMFQPLVFLALAALLDRSTMARAFLFVSLALGQAIVTPESAFTAAACAVVVVAFEGYHRERSQPLVRSFRRTVACAALTILLGLVWLGYLAAHGALDDFLHYYKTFGSGHRLTRGIPVTAGEFFPPFGFAVVAPVVVVVASFWYAVARLGRRVPFSVEDWTMLAAALLLFIYYTKFLSRADAHIYQVLFVVPALIYYVLYKIVSAGEAALARFRAGQLLARVTAGRPVTAVVLLVGLGLAPYSVTERLAALSRNVRPEAAHPPRLKKLGYAVSTAFDEAVAADLSAFFREQGSTDRVFDLTNQPALFHYVLGLRPATRYYHVSMTIRQQTQADLLDQLRRDPPEFVIFDSRSSGLPQWDEIPNAVRHYDVSQFILERYRPLREIHGSLIMSRGQPAASPPDRERALYFQGAACDWRYAPNFFAPTRGRLAAGGEPLAVPFRAVRPGLRVRGWAADVNGGEPATVVLIVRGGVAVGSMKPAMPRPDVVSAFKKDGLLLSGYDGTSLPVPITAAFPRAGETRVFGVSRRGAVSELQVSLDSGIAEKACVPLAHIEVDGKRVPITPGAVDGWVERVESSEGFVTEIEIPRELRRSGFGILEIVSRDLAADEFLLTDGGANPPPGRTISFRSLEAEPAPFRVQVGSCSQWYGFDSATLYLHHRVPQQFQSISVRRNSRP